MSKVLVNEIVKAYNAKEILYKTDEENVIIVKIGHRKTFQTFQLLCHYEKHHEDRDSE